MSTGEQAPKSSIDRPLDKSTPPIMPEKDSELLTRSRVREMLITRGFVVKLAKKKTTGQDQNLRENTDATKGG